MSKENEQDMRPEYDMRGGVRGKYFERYRQGVSFTLVLDFKDSPLVAKSTSSGRPEVGSITHLISYPILPVSPDFANKASAR